MEARLKKNLEERTDNNEEVEVNTETEEKETLEENKVEEEAGEENKEPSTEELLEKIAEIEKSWLQKKRKKKPSITAWSGYRLILAIIEKEMKRKQKEYRLQ